MTTVALRRGDKVPTALSCSRHAVVTTGTTTSGIIMIKAIGLPTARTVAGIALRRSGKMTTGFTRGRHPIVTTGTATGSIAVVKFRPTPTHTRRVAGVTLSVGCDMST